VSQLGWTRVEFYQNLFAEGVAFQELRTAAVKRKGYDIAVNFLLRGQQ
jgi:hypothetical protein